MGREIRRVPPNWQHPENEHGFKPLHDQSYLEALNEWLENHRQWEAGTHRDLSDGVSKVVYPHYAYWGGNAPDVESYRPEWKPGEATWWQVYETVSEGTPVTPPFATQQELVEYLVTEGDFWDQRRRKEGVVSVPCQPWTRKQAESFVFGHQWAPSMVIKDGRAITGIEAMAELPTP